LAQVPKTAAGFVKDFTALQRGKDQKNMLTYLQHIPTKTIETYFKRTEVEAEVFSAIMETIKFGVLSNDDISKWAASFLVSLSKADNFELTLSFAEDEDRTNIETVIKSLQKSKDDTVVSNLVQIQAKFVDEA